MERTQEAGRAQRHENAVRGRRVIERNEPKRKRVRHHAFNVGRGRLAARL